MSDHPSEPPAETGEAPGKDDWKPKKNGWYYDPTYPVLAYEWTDEGWGQTIMRRNVPQGTACLGHPFAGTTPQQAARDKEYTAAEAKQDRKMGFGCLGVIAAVVLVAGIAIAIGAQQNSESKVGHTEMTKANGLAYCEEAVSAHLSGSPAFAVDGEAFEDASTVGQTTYKATLRAQIGSQLSHWQCRLVWTGNAWSIDALVGP